MRILITNDDGWGAKGILTLVKAMRTLGDVTVVAPSGPRSGQSNAITVAQPIHIKPISDEPGLHIYTCSGTPSDCVKAALNVISPTEDGKGGFDLVVSGINHGDNGCINVIYSGTMGAVYVGLEHEIPSIGFSLCDHNPDADFSFMEPYLISLTKDYLASLRPKRFMTGWNVNAPVGPIAGVRFTRQTRGYWDKEYARYEDPMGRTFYMLSGEFVNLEPDAEDTDQWATSHHFVSVTPTCVDTTDYESLG